MRTLGSPGTKAVSARRFAGEQSGVRGRADQSNRQTLSDEEVRQVLVDPFGLELPPETIAAVLRSLPHHPYADSFTHAVIQSKMPSPDADGEGGDLLANAGEVSVLCVRVYHRRGAAT
jgi:hypothetical protein